MAAAEQSRPGATPRMSGVLWDMFSGSAPYGDVFLRMIRPGFLGRFLWSVARPGRGGIRPAGEGGAR